MAGRLVAMFFMAILGFAVMIANLAILACNRQYASAAWEQSERTLLLDGGRGNIFDCNFVPLTGVQQQTWALIAPGRTSYRTLFDAIPAAQRGEFYQKIQSGAPFLMQVENAAALDAQFVFSRRERYYPLPVAPHLLGYLDAGQNGRSGIEYACNDILTGGSTREEVRCVTMARGGFARGQKPDLVYTQGTGGGVMLTLDVGIQRICEAVAAQMVDKGSIVVLECATGRVRASVSMPTFDPRNVAQSIADNDTSLINRSVSAYNVGSVFKPILAAAALEGGIDPTAVYECRGATSVNGHVYRCAHGKSHGKIDLQGALEQSCNCYFVQLGLALGSARTERAAAGAGFGEGSPVAEGLRAASGNLPGEVQLRDLGQLASVSFGQGALTATPVQVAASINIFANHGLYIAPSFVEGYVNEYSKTVTQSLYRPVQRQAFRPAAAERVRQMLVSVVENGMGRAARPLYGGAGGKTGTAQTGRYTQSGEEELDAWFAGFFPAEEPQYTVAVLLDSGTHQSEDAARIFAAVADALHFYMLDTGGDTAAAADGTVPDSAPQGY